MTIDFDNAPSVAFKKTPIGPRTPEQKDQKIEQLKQALESQDGLIASLKKQISDLEKFKAHDQEFLMMKQRYIDKQRTEIEQLKRMLAHKDEEIEGKKRRLRGLRKGMQITDEYVQELKEEIRKLKTEDVTYV